MEDDMNHKVIAARVPTAYTSIASEDLLARIKKGDDARNQLIIMYLPLVKLIAEQYSDEKRELDDLVQEGSMAVTYALNEYLRLPTGNFTDLVAQHVHSTLKKLTEKDPQEQVLSIRLNDGLNYLENIFRNVVLRGPEDLALNGQLIQILQEYFNNSLPAEDANVLAKRFGIGTSKPLSRSAVSRELGIPENKLKLIEENAIEVLRKHLLTDVNNSPKYPSSQVAKKGKRPFRLWSARFRF